MRPYASLFLLAAFSCCVLSCDFPGGFGNSGKPNNNPGGQETGGDLAEFRAMYQMEVVNNTDSAVSVFSGLFVVDHPGSYYYISVYNDALCAVAGNKTGTTEFSWGPRGRLDYPEYFDVDTQWPTVEEMKARFRPCISAFFLKICIEGKECYLAGWPEFVNLPPLTEPDYFGFVLDTGKIVKYGIGYGHNKEVRVNESDIVYIPFIISYDQDGQTEEHDFDYAEIVYGKAVLTIDAPDRIAFQTIALSLSPDDL